MAVCNHRFVLEFAENEPQQHPTSRSLIEMSLKTTATDSGCRANVARRRRIGNLIISLRFMNKTLNASTTLPA
jgi:hypothetical protein